jgi:hypothetical protein
MTAALSLTVVDLNIAQRSSVVNNIGVRIEGIAIAVLALEMLILGSRYMSQPVVGWRNWTVAAFFRLVNGRC